MRQGTSPMAGRNHLRELPSQSRQQLIPLAEDPLRRCAPPQHHPPAIDDRIAAHQRELQALLLENQRLAATHVALKQELTSTHQDLRHLAAISQKIKAQRDAEIREVLERSVKVEAEYRALNAFKAEFAVVKEDVEKLKVEKEELGAQLSVVNGDLARAKSDLRDLPEIRAEMESITQDIEKGRAALEIERKNRTINLEHGLEMEKNKLSRIEEINRLQAELDNAIKRARAAAANQGPGYGTMYPNPNMVYGGGSYPVQYQMYQGQGIPHVTPHYGQGPVFSGPVDTPRENGQI